MNSIPLKMDDMEMKMELLREALWNSICIPCFNSIKNPISIRRGKAIESFTPVEMVWKGNR